MLSNIVFFICFRKTLFLSLKFFYLCYSVRVYRNVSYLLVCYFLLSLSLPLCFFFSFLFFFFFSLSPLSLPHSRTFLFFILLYKDVCFLLFILFAFCPFRIDFLYYRLAYMLLIPIFQSSLKTIVFMSSFS